MLSGRKKMLRIDAPFQSAGNLGYRNELMLVHAAFEGSDHQMLIVRRVSICCDPGNLVMSK